MTIAIITIIPILITVSVINFLHWKSQLSRKNEAKPYDYANQPDDLPKWTPMNTVAKSASAKLKRMYRGGCL